jgi:Flp pilus assembly protein TadD
MTKVIQSIRPATGFVPVTRLAPLCVALGALLIAGCTTGGPQGAGDTAGRQAQGTLPADVTTATVMTLAERMRANGDYNSAVTFYRRAIMLDPFNLKAYLGLGDTLLAAGYPNEASEAFRSYLSQSPKDKAINDAPAYRGLGMALVALGRPQEAVEILTKSIALEPSPRAFSALGIAEDMIGDTAAAEGAYKRGLVLAPDDLDLLNNYGLSQALHGDFNGAVVTLRRVASDQRAGVRHRANLALALGLAGRTDDAAQVARIDLDERSVKSNLAYYAELRALPAPERANAILRPNTPIPPRAAATSCDKEPCPVPKLPGEKLSAAPQTPVDSKPLAPPPTAAKPIPVTPPASVKPDSIQPPPAEKKAPVAAKEPSPVQDRAKPDAAPNDVKPSAPVQLTPQNSAKADTPMPAPEMAKNEPSMAPAESQPAAAPGEMKPGPEASAPPMNTVDNNVTPKPAGENPPVVANTAKPSTEASITPAPETAADKPSFSDPAPTPARVSSGPVVKAAAVAPMAPGKHAWLQIASFRSEQNAQSAWKTMTEGNQDLLQYVPLSVHRVDLGTDKGTFYVLRIGPLATTQQAGELCSALKDRKIDCMVTK